MNLGQVLVQAMAEREALRRMGLGSKTQAVASAPGGAPEIVPSTTTPGTATPMVRSVGSGGPGNSTTQHMRGDASPELATGHGLDWAGNTLLVGPLRVKSAVVSGADVVVTVAEGVANIGGANFYFSGDQTVTITGAATSTTYWIKVNGSGALTYSTSAPAAGEAPLATVATADPLATETLVITDKRALIASAAGSAPADVVRQDGAAIYAADAEASDAYAITLSPAPGSLTVGMVINFKANTANTGAATLNVNSLGAVTIKKHHDQDLANGDIEAGQIVTVVYDGTYWQMQSQLGNAPAGGGTVIEVLLRRTGSFTVPHNTGEENNLISWQVEDSDTDGMWDSGQPTRITCQTAGRYAFHVRFDMTSNGSGGRNFRAHHKNAAGTLLDHQDFGWGPYSGTINRGLVVFTFDMAVGDYVEFGFYQSSGGNLTVGVEKYPRVYGWKVA